MTRSLTLGILFSKVVRAVVVAKLVILGISFLISFVLALRVVLVAKLVILCTLLSLLKSTRTGTNLSKSYLSTLLFKLLKLVTTLNLSISNLSTSVLDQLNQSF